MVVGVMDESESSSLMIKKDTFSMFFDGWGRQKRFESAKCGGPQMQLE